MILGVYLLPLSPRLGPIFGGKPSHDSANDRRPSYAKKKGRWLDLPCWLLTGTAEALPLRVHHTLQFTLERLMGGRFCCPKHTTEVAGVLFGVLLTAEHGIDRLNGGFSQQLQLGGSHLADYGLECVEGPAAAFLSCYTYHSTFFLGRF